MMVNFHDLDGNPVGEVELPPQFKEEIRPDLIKRAVLAIYSHKRQPYGKDPRAGKETSAWTSKRRRDYRSSYGRGISRVPRAIVAGKGFRIAWIARRVPQAVKGYKAHGPSSERIWYEKINKKERKKAIRSAIASTANEYFVKKRYEKISRYLDNVLNRFSLPLIFDGLNEIERFKDLRIFIEKIFPEPILDLISKKKVRSGKGKMRGRRTVKSRGILIVVPNEDHPLAWKKFQYGEIIPVKYLNAEVLAPGAKPGRLTIWDKSAIDRLKNEKLFY